MRSQMLVGSWLPCDTTVQATDGRRLSISRSRVAARAYGLGLLPLHIDHSGPNVGWVVGVAVVERTVRFVAVTEDASRFDGWGCSPTWGHLPGGEEVGWLEVSATRTPAVESAAWVAHEGDAVDAAALVGLMLEADRREREAAERAVREMAVARGHQHFLDPEMKRLIEAPMLHRHDPHLRTT